MLIAYKVLLLIMIVISFIGVIGEKNKPMQEKMLVLFVCSLVSFTVSVMYL